MTTLTQMRERRRLLTLLVPPRAEEPEPAPVVVVRKLAVVAPVAPEVAALDFEEPRPRVLPLTRGDCVDGPRPCPLITCRHHLYPETCTGGRAPGRAGHVTAPYYEADGIQLYCGDALQILESIITGPIAALIFDPPYASGARTEAAKPSSGAMVRGARWNQKPIDNDQMTTAGFVWLMREVLLAIAPSIIAGGSVLSFIDWRQWPNLVGATESCNLRVQPMLVWDKQSMGLGNGFRRQHELVMHAAKGVPRVFDRGCPDIISCARDSNVDHPSPKPEKLMRRLIEVVTEKGDLVLDPFAGAGATLVAARSLGRRAIGFELSEKHCATTVDRLRQGTLLGLSSPPSEVA